jgi:hypothetical protein
MVSRLEHHRLITLDEESLILTEDLLDHPYPIP